MAARAGAASTGPGRNRQTSGLAAKQNRQTAQTTKNHRGQAWVVSVFLPSDQTYR